jgi:transcriptional antiterminator NusG
MDTLENPHNGFAWFVIQTLHLREQKAQKLIYSNLVSQNLHDYVKEMLIPTRQVITVNKGVAKKKVHKVFSGYIMIHMQPSKILINTINKSNYVIGFLGDSKTDPTPLDEQSVRHILDISNVDSADKNYINDFKVGEMVRVIDGPFTDFKGTIKQINNKKTSCILNVYILGRATPVELSFFQVEKES